MSLGSVLLQPQALAAAQRALDERPPNALLDLLTRLASEMASGGPGLQIIEDEFAASLESLAADVEPRLQAARTRIEDLLNPLIGMVEETLGGESEGDGFDRAVDKGKAFSAAVATALGGLTSARLGQVAGALFDVLESDLGLNEARGRAFLSGTADRISTRLQADYIAGAADPAAYNRFALGAALREVLAMAGQEIDLPALNKSTLLPALVERLQTSGMDGRIADAQAATLKVTEAFTALSGLKQFLSGSGASPFALVSASSRAGVAAAEPEHCWYASWLKGEAVSHPDCTNNPDLEGVDFGETITAQTMEDLTRVSSFLSSVAEAILHFRSIQQGDIVSNAVNGSWHVIEAALALFANYDPPRWLKWLFAFLASGLGGLERARFNDWFGTLLILSDLAETQLYSRWTWLPHEALLSIFTLANNTRSRVNNNYIEGVAHAFGELGNLFMALILAKARKRDFGIPAGGRGSWGATIGFVLAGMGTNIFLTLVVGSLVASALAGGGTDAGRVFRLLLKDRIFGRGTGGVLILQTLATLIVHITDFYIYYFEFADGETAGGKLSGVGKEQLEFPGYPSRATSPYSLPWANGKLYQCAQGNHGLWSHTPFGFDLELYAFDWNFDDGDEVLAMREGVVWDYTESNENGSTDYQNEIIIMHKTGASPLAGHDFDENNVPARTFAVYMHGRKNGITDAFLVPPSKEKDAPGFGTPVKKGQVIMLADDTGRSAYNHLHIQIKPMNLAVAQPANYTIPFVFSDEEVAGDDGVPRSGKWYDSSNVKVD